MTDTEIVQHLRQDEFFPSLRVIVQEHAEIHDGDGYHFSDIFHVPAHETFHVLLKNPVNNFPHVRAFTTVTTNAPAQINLFEDVTYSNQGTSVTEFNKNRNDPDDANLEIFSDATVTDTGTRIDVDVITGARTAGGSSQLGIQEFILKEGTDYALCFEDKSGIPNDIRFRIFWYE